MPNLAETPLPPPALAQSFEALLEFLREPDLGLAALSPSRFIRLVGIDLQTLAAQAHVHRNTIVDPGKWTRGLDRMPRNEQGDRRGKKAV